MVPLENSRVVRIFEGVLAVLLSASAWGCRAAEGDEAPDAGTVDDAGADIDADADSDSDSDSDSGADAGDDAAAVEEECFDGDFTISSSQDNAAFKPYPCIEGFLTVTGLEDSAALDLPNLTDVFGNLSISGNAGLTDLAGLSALEFVHGDLKIIENGALKSLAGLESLVSPTSALIIANNESLESIEALSGFQGFGDYEVEQCYCWLAIGGNPALSSLTGLEGIGPFCGVLELWNNESLDSLSALSGMESVELERLLLEKNPALVELTGLEGITYASLTIVTGNEALESLVGLANLDWVWTLEITDNKMLSSLQGLSSLKTVQWRLDIERNSSLPTCEAWDLLDDLDILPYQICLQENLEDTCNDETWNCEGE